jgi:hypothetical protein
MKAQPAPSLVAATLMSVLAFPALPSIAGDEPPKEPPKIQIPQPGVPQIMTMQGRFVRAAYNNEGYAILAYRVANLSVGEKWMLLEVGITLRDNMPDEKLTRGDVTLDTPDGHTIPLATNEEYRGAPVQMLEKRAEFSHDPINYFPPNAQYPCRIGFFADLSDPGAAYDQVELNQARACMGRLFFKIPAGIERGQHWLNIKFANSVVRVPFRILTKEEYKILDEHYDDIEKQVKDAFKPKG